VAPAPPAAASGLTSPATTATLPAADHPGSTPAPVRSYAPVPAGQVQLTLTFAAASWVGVSDADGRHLLQGLFSAGSAHSVNGTPPLHVVLGNAPQVALAINGKPVPVGALAHRDGSLRLLVDASGRVSAAAPRLAHGD
jgi:cytoskeleton protein RodZ